VAAEIDDEQLTELRSLIVGPEQRELLLAPHLEDIALLEQITGESFEQWRTYRDGGSFESRRSSRDSTVLILLLDFHRTERNEIFGAVRLLRRDQSW